MTPPTDCEHEKVFSGERHPTGIPAYFWICARCLTAGTESLTKPPKRETERFNRLMELAEARAAGPEDECE